MTPPNPYAAYTQTEPETKEELLIKTYEEILSLLNVARMAIEEKDIKAKAEALSKVTNALAILQASLDLENGGEIAENLSKIYDFCILELVKANANNDKERVVNVIEILEPIYEGFKEAYRKEKGEKQA